MDFLETLYPRAQAANRRIVLPEGQDPRVVRAAIEINPAMHNAFKNLGLALEGQGRRREAAEAYIRATESGPMDSRALRHLEDLVAANEEFFASLGDIHEQLRQCRDAVEQAARMFGTDPPS